ncbi:MAG: tetratricopeptide repeat protein, partial [Bacteroides sp.]|nr:tetratricopeptide repeat protein [Bacteroides sp.]
GWKDVLFPIADFYLSKERWDEAIEIYNDLEYIGGFIGESAECYQKLGYALQKRKKYTEAIQAYLTADTLKPDNIWNNRHLAICYRLNRNYQAALTYYKKVEEAAPKDAHAIFYIGSCLVELKQYEEALNYFFKLDFIENNCIKAWRGIGWCSFINEKYEQAMKYYEKIIEQKPLAIDYMNAGHVAWVMGDIQKAAVFYGKAITASGNRERFLEMFHKDKDSLIIQGIREEDIPLMLDLL